MNYFVTSFVKPITYAVRHPAGEEERRMNKHERTNRAVNTQQGLLHQDFNWKQITNKYQSTCCVCNRGISIGETILWHKDQSLVQHLPEVCKILGPRKKRVSTRELGTNPRAKGTNPKAIAEARLAKRIEEYTFPVEVRYVN
jgi:hypothetical protein